MSDYKIYFSDLHGKKYIEKNFDSEKNNHEWIEVGLEFSNGKKYRIDLLTGKMNISGEWIEIGKDINGYYEKFTGRGLDYRKNLFYYCESVPMGMGSRGLVAKNIYLGYECDLDNLKINYGLYSVEKYIACMVYNCEEEKIGLTLSTDVNFNVNGKKINVKI